MSRVAVITMVLVLAAGLFAQEEGRPPYDEQPPVAPPTYPEDMDPGVRPVPPNMPPDTSAPPRELSSAEAEEQIQLKLDAEPSLRNNQLEVEVTEDEVVVSGTADSEAERDVAIRIAESYAGERPVVNKVEIRGTA
jgi:HSP20 family molecular chaperone IbpA